MIAAVLGSPIAHSLSPVLHLTAYRELGLQHEYRKIEVDAESFREFVDTLTSNWLGLSLTMPLKEIAFDVAQSVSPVALLTRSINTLICGDELMADNTDVTGIVQAIKESSDSPFDRLVLLGSGATARSAIVAAAQLDIGAIYAVARNEAALLECASIAKRLGMEFEATSIYDLEFTPETLTINTTPAGVADRLVEVVQPEGALLDVVYHPWPSILAKHWLSHDLTIISGHLMLLHQAAKQVELMTGQTAPVEAMRVALLTAMRSR
ncbi:MAG: shikimate dehydrogenase [Actinobacteria bacterium]|uniref:Unannotated protein n=1 Tax=freshwater metagenome TaxID=449393 RepID=A0A6J5YN86_9ZZZZ|nr:shikimate dehydrogenase [Actinomycetota bacterium]